MTTAGWQILVFLACLVGVGAFEGAETALLAADRLRIRVLAKAKRAGAELSLDLLQRRDQILVTLLVCSTLLSAAAAALATSLIEDWLGTTVGATLLATFGVTIVVLVFGQVLPKNVARSHAEPILIGASRPLFGLDLLLLPVTAAASLVVHLMLRLLRGGRHGRPVTREDLRVLVQDVHGDTGPLRQEKRMLQSILDFGHTTAREVMVPMPSVASLDKESSLDMLRALVRRRGYTRIPVFDQRVDQVAGVVQVFDVLLDPEKGETIEDYMRPVTLVPETKRIDRLMVEMQRRGESMVVVVNEFGSCTGVVTMEDIVEEIMGELADEHEVGVKRIRSLGEGVYIVDALTDIDDLNEELKLDLPKLRYDTLGGLVMRKLGRIPREGERFDLSGVSFEVIEVYPFGVKSVKLSMGDRQSQAHRKPGRSRDES
jgi:putative hemolysin